MFWCLFCCIVVYLQRSLPVLCLLDMLVLDNLEGVFIQYVKGLEAPVDMGFRIHYYFLLS